ncbi:threonine synthase [Wallemia mellicola]|nr:threonine synthase [Wallemia mellicola]
MSGLANYQKEFITTCLSNKILKFGTFTLKSGRTSPYFFNAGDLSTGELVLMTARAYAEAILASGVKFDMLFGPAYKGIPLVAATALILQSEHKINVPFAFDRKEAKTHGEGGNIIGAPFKGKVLVLDDVITGGTSIRHSINLIKNAGEQAEFAGVVVSVDRQEKGQGEKSAIQEVESEYGVNVFSVIAFSTTATAITKEQLEDIAPKTSSCTDAKYADECATSEVAAEQLTKAIEEHKLSESESAAVIAWQLNESLEYRYNINHFSNGQEKHNPGQGSRCMANSQFLAAYVAAHDDLRSQSPVELEANATPASITGMNISDEDKDKILDLVLDDAHSWDVAFWFYDSQCTDSVKEQLKDGGLDAFMQQCAILQGLAPNGGLYIPSEIPSLPANWEEKWINLPFEELAYELTKLFVPEDSIPADDLKDLIRRSYATFRHSERTPITQVGSNRFVLELFHGPTFAFKDVALQFLGNLFEYFLKRRNANKQPGDVREKLTIVGATSGDTGSAAIYGVRGKDDISIFILHPKGRVSPIQEAQMTTVLDSNVHNCAVQGTFDDCQDIVKSLFSDKPFNDTHKLGAVNSINWARILSQITYYFYSYFLAKKQTPAGSEVQFVVPTGNFGDILAGFYAKKLGLPSQPMVIATNANDILTRFWRTGVYEKYDSNQHVQAVEGAVEAAQGSSDGKQALAVVGGVKATLSPAMDILVSSNFERLLWYIVLESMTKGDKIAASKQVNNWMNELKTNGRFSVPEEALAVARRDFTASSVNDEQTTQTIKQYFSQPEPGFKSYTVDPHTAVGLKASSDVKNESNVYQICLATAHAAKFSEAVENALKDEASFNFERDVLPTEFHGLMDKQRRVIDIEGIDPELTKRVVESKAVKEATHGNVGI